MHRDPHGRADRADGDRTHRPSDGFRLRDRRRFTRLVAELLPSLPDRMRAALRDATIEVADVPADDSLRLATFSRPPQGPARLTVYRRPLEARASSRADLQSLVLSAVGRTVAAELGLQEDLDDWDDLDD